MAKDSIYQDLKSGAEPFRFDETVAAVFPDMLRRSIPGYAVSIEAIGSLAARYVQDDTRCYDLGCSLGAATLAMRQGIQASGCTIIAVDNAAAMVERCRQIVAKDDAAHQRTTNVDVSQGNIEQTAISNASMVVLNYTLQFLKVPERDKIICKIFNGLVSGGLLVLSEKIEDEDPVLQALLVELQHEYKRRNDYSALEISRKRAALEDVLIPETLARHRKRLQSAGFDHIAVWLRYFNFVSIIAIRK